MGLVVIVGVLAEMEDLGEEDAVRSYQSQFVAANRALRDAGLPEHREPVNLGEQDPVELEMGGYSSLHYLRRIAAHLWAGKGLPPPGNRDASADPVMRQYYDSLGENPGRFGGKAPGRGTRFDHLLFHSDAEGLYVPIEFREVIIDGTPPIGIPGGMLGSSISLRAECGALAGALGLPPNMDPDSDELGVAYSSQGEGKAGWQRYGIESFVCARLIHAAEASVRLGAAIAFA